MLNCNLCDYYSTLTYADGFSSPSKAICGFTDTIFRDDITNSGTEYPCSNMFYSDYLKKSQKIIHKVISFANDDWRFIYKRTHINAITSRV
jgi:hypothetical protein